MANISAAVGIRNGRTMLPNRPADLAIVTDLFDHIPEANGGAAEDAANPWPTDRTELINLVTAQIVFFQSTNNRTPDGALDPAGGTLQLMNQFAAPPGSVRVINQQILGMAGGDDNLIPQIIPPISVILPATFRAGVQSNRFSFTSTAGTVGRLAIFAAQKGGIERAVILLLPGTGVPDGVIICITQGFAQAAKDLNPLGWSNPLSPPFVQFCLLKHVINRWGAQTLAASRKNLAFVYIVRAQGSPELGPFANDGPFVRDTLSQMASLTNGSFTFNDIAAFTFSSGISDFNLFLGSVSGILNVTAVYNIDPASAHGCVQPPGAVRKQYLSGQTGGPRPGFEFMPMDRWQNEWNWWRKETLKDPWPFNYMHNLCMPMYVLNLALQT